jgi:hypothetical protein
MIGVIIGNVLVYHITRWLANQNEVVATLFMIFGAHSNIFFIIKVRDFVLTKWSYSPPQIMLTIGYHIFEQVVQSLLNI